ncbi:hypothetical protein [Bifidobacterium sp. SO1]|uniref:hypothetical protein n=1 Tax=Bifidobacterium sp. SO1 TaxID=2809029 RepID=UPI001BDBC989|nr:hypothetical protein [Bifidobacterium sp. SO1]MBT1161834.1 hypothetical protein [Bifidobacterium sp. SO1]
MCGYETIENPGRLGGLACRLLDPEREHTSVIISSRFADGRPGFDPARVARLLDGTDARVYWLRDPQDARRLAELTDGRIVCYDGAARVCPRGMDDRIVMNLNPDSLDYLISRAMRAVTFIGRDRESPPPPMIADGSGEELRRLRSENDMLKGRIRKLRRLIADDPDDLLACYDDPAQWLDLQLRVAWARMIPPADKPNRPLPAEWSYSPAFPVAVASSPCRGQLVDECARILTGLDDSHALRDGPAGSPVTLGEWGRPVWRAYAQSNTPNAWRIHYTRDASASIRFLSAGGHDDLI